MLVVSLAMALVLAAPSPTDPTTLVDRLGSPRYAHREAAGEALAKLGRDAVPALRVGLESRDPEIRERSAAILSRIEEGLLIQPTLIPLDVRDETLAGAIAAINERAGVELTPTPENHPDWTETRLTLKTPGPLPFWKAVDALCAAGHMHYAFGAPAQLGQKDTAFPLYPGDAPGPELISDSGPFRVQLASIHSQSDIQLARPQPPVGVRARSVEDAGGRGRTPALRQFYFQLVVAAEPRLSIAQDGPTRMIHAVDDRGHSLLPAPGADVISHSSGYFGINASPSLQVRVDLARPEATGERIRVLRGVVPVSVSARKPGPITIPLSDAIGKTFRDDQVVLSVAAVHPGTEARPATIELAARPIARKAEANPETARPEATPQQIEILDERGVALPWFQANASYNGEEARYTLTLLARGLAAPASIRYHEVARATTEVPFEFRDVPMP